MALLCFPNCCDVLQSPRAGNRPDIAIYHAGERSTVSLDGILTVRFAPAVCKRKSTPARCALPAAARATSPRPSKGGSLTGMWGLSNAVQNTACACFE